MKRLHSNPEICRTLGRPGWDRCRAGGTMLVAVAVAVSVQAGTATACLWDTDTLSQERSRFPTTLELITGKFLRHGRAFYLWRVDERRKRIEAGERRPEYYDDVAVAMDKMGHVQSAIRWMKDKERISPGKYETYANLGTFHIHAGELEEGAKWIRKALEINPEAHFGREKYQLMLVEYQLARHAGLSREQASDTDRFADDGSGLTGFAAYVMRQRREELSMSGGDAGSASSEVQAETLAAARKGVQGMMRFGRHDSPILLEALGDLLVLPDAPAQDARRLAARAYLLGAQNSGDSQDKKRLLQKAKSAVEMHEDLTLNDIRTQLIEEIRDANDWFAALNQRERAWIHSSGTDPEAEFLKLYTQEPLIGVDDPLASKAGIGWRMLVSRLAAILTAILVVCAGLGIFIARHWLRQPAVATVRPLDE